MIRPLSLHLAVALALMGPLLHAAQPSAAGAAPADKPVPGQGVFVAVGYGGFRGWSIDGQNWTAERWSDKNADDCNVIFTLVYRAGVFYASGGGGGGPFGPPKGFILRSVDGKHWDEVVTNKWRVSVVIDLGDRLLSAFDDHFQLSADGITWKPAAEAKMILPNEGPGWQNAYFRRWVAGNGAAVFAGDYALPDNKPRIGWIGGSKNGDTPLAMTREERRCVRPRFRQQALRRLHQDRRPDPVDRWPPVQATGTSGDQHDDSCLRFHDGLFYLRGKKGVQTSSDGEHWTAAANPPQIPKAVSPDGIAVDCGWGGLTSRPMARAGRRRRCRSTRRASARSSMASRWPICPRTARRRGRRNDRALRTLADLITTRDAGGVTGFRPGGWMEAGRMVHGCIRHRGSPPAGR
jgi:hypothetical protein